MRHLVGDLYGQRLPGGTDLPPGELPRAILGTGSPQAHGRAARVDGTAPGDGRVLEEAAAYQRQPLEQLALGRVDLRAGGGQAEVAGLPVLQAQVGIDLQLQLLAPVDDAEGADVRAGPWDRHRRARRPQRPQRRQGVDQHRRLLDRLDEADRQARDAAALAVGLPVLERRLRPLHGDVPGDQGRVTLEQQLAHAAPRRLEQVLVAGLDRIGPEHLRRLLPAQHDRRPRRVRRQRPDAEGNLPAARARDLPAAQAGDAGVMRAG